MISKDQQSSVKTEEQDSKEQQSLIKTEEQYEKEFVDKTLKLQTEDKSRQMRRYSGKSLLDKKSYDIVKYQVADKEKESYLNEKKNILKILELRHSNIIRYFEFYVFQDTEQNDDDGDKKAIFAYIKQEHTHEVAGSLEKLLEQSQKALSQFECFEKLNDLYNAMIYLKEKDISHGSINPHTILIAFHGDWKLCDFHHCIEKQSNTTTHTVAVQGSQPDHYHSPLKAQSLKQVQNQCRFSPEKNDIWSLGVVFVRCLTHHSDEEIKELTYPKLKSEERLEKLMNKVTGDYWKSLINGMLQYDEEKRFDIKTLGIAMQQGQINFQ